MSLTVPNDPAAPAPVSQSPTVEAGPVIPQAAPAPQLSTPALSDADFSTAVSNSLDTAASKARFSTYVARTDGSSPDMEAQLRQIAQTTGVPLVAVRANPDAARVQAQQAQTPWDQMAKMNPATASYLSNPDNARLIHDDIPATANVEAAVGGTGAPYAFDGQASGALPYRQRIANMISNVSPMLASVFAGEPLPTSSNPQTQAISDAINGGPLDIFTQAAGSAGTLGLIPAAPVNPNETGSQVASGLGGLAGFFAGPLGIGRAAVAGLEKFAPLAVDGSESLLKAAVKSATTTGVELGVASGAGSTGQALDTSSLGDAGLTVAKSAGTGAAMGAAMGALSRVLPDNTVLQAVSRVAGSTVLNDAITGARPWDDRPLGQKIVDYGVNSIFSLQGAGRTDGSWLHDAARAEVAASDGQILANINEAAPLSKLRERDPNAFSDFVAQANENGPLQHVYVDGDVLTNALNQAGVSRDELAQKLPDVAEQLDLANQTGGQVQISIPDFATHLTGDKFQDNLLEYLRTSPDAMTTREANEFRASSADQFAAHAESAFNDAELRSDHDLSTQDVHDQVLANLNEVNRFPTDTNQVYARMIGGFYGTMSERLGMSPQEMFAKYPLNVAAEDVSGSNSLNQEASTEGEVKPGSLSDFIEQAHADNDLDMALKGYSIHGSTPEVRAYAEQLKDLGLKAGFEFRPQYEAFNKGAPAEYWPAGHEDGKGHSVALFPNGAGMQEYAVMHEATHAALHDKINKYADMKDPQTPEDVRGVKAIAKLEAIRQKALEVAGPEDHYGLTDLHEFTAELKSNPQFQDFLDSKELNGKSLWERTKDAFKSLLGFKGTGTYFNKAIEATDSLFPQGAVNQVNQGSRGKLSFADDISTAPSTITLLKNADLSTFLHESGHHFLNVLDHVSKTGPDDVKGDMKAVTDWFGTTPEAWRQMSLEQKRPMHEQFARGFESYLREGNSPNIELRSVFQKMRAWLVNVYSNISKLGVSLNSEVRGVFDRMLASNAEIQLAEASRSYAPLFKSPEEAGMSQEDYASYQALGNEATMSSVEQLQGRTLRDMKWLENRKGEALKGVQKDVATKRADMEETVRAALEADPVYQAREAIEGPAREIDPDLVAERYGFSSGDEMTQKIKEAPPLEDAIKSATDTRMMQQYGDISSPEAMNQAADVAIHNAARTRFIATEFKALAKAVGPARELAAAAKDVAQKTIAAKKIRDLSPAMFTAAETRAAKIAESLRIKGDIAGAAKAKRDQLLNNQLAKASMDAQADVDADLRYLRRFDFPKKNGAVDPEYRRQIEQLLDQYDLRRSTTLTDISKRKSLADYVKRQEESTGITPDIPESLLINSSKVSYKDMTVEGWRGLVDAIKSIEHVGKLKGELLVTAAKRDFDDFVSQAAATIRANGGEAKPVEPFDAPSRARNLIEQTLANSRTLASRLQQFDGADGGFLWDSIIRPMNDAGTKEASLREASAKALKEITKPFVNTRLHEKTFIPEINDSMSREQMISAALNMGNEANMQRLMGGYKWSRAQLNAVVGHLGSADWRAVQGVWDHIDTYWPQINAKNERVFGVPLGKVESQPLLTPTGERLRGGYYPIKYDTRLSTKAENDSDAQALKDMLAATYTRAQTQRGFTNTRLDEVNRPLQLSLDVISRHVDEVTHDLAWHEWVVDASRIFKSSAVDEAIREHYGAATSKTIKNTIASIAGGDIAGRADINGVLNWMRQGTIVSRLGWNMTTILRQFMGLGTTAAAVGTAHTRDAMVDYLSSPVRQAHIGDMIDAKSDYMRVRNQMLDRDLGDFKKAVDSGKHPILDTIAKVPGVDGVVDGVVKPVVATIAHSYMWAIERAQRHVDAVSWLAGYKKAQAMGFDESKSIGYADQTVRESQGSGMVADRPQIMSQDGIRLFTTFFSAANATYNVTAKQFGQAQVSKATFVKGLVAAYVVPALMNSLLDQLRGSENHSESWQEKISKSFGWNLLGGFAGGLPLIRDFASAAQFGSATPPAMQMIDDFGALFKGNSLKSRVKPAVSLAGDVLHLPTGAVMKAAAGVEAMREGKAGPSAIVLGAPTKN